MTCRMPPSPHASSKKFPQHLLEDLSGAGAGNYGGRMYGSSMNSGGYGGAYGGYRRRPRSASGSDDETGSTSRHYSYEDEDQTATRFSHSNTAVLARASPKRIGATTGTAKKPGFDRQYRELLWREGRQSAGARFARPKTARSPRPPASHRFSERPARPPSEIRRRHHLPARRATATMRSLQYNLLKFGIKKLVEKFAQLERA